MKKIVLLTFMLSVMFSGLVYAVGPGDEIMYMPMDGDPNDIVGSSTNVITGCTFDPGVFGNELHLNSSGDQVIYTKTLDTISAFTISYWYKPNNTSSTWYTVMNIPGVVAIWANSSESPLCRTSCELEFAGYQGGGGNLVAGHVVLTYDGTDCKVYNNGTLFDETLDISVAVPLTATSLEISPDAMNCALDDVRIYDVALDATEVAALYAFNLNPTITTQPGSIVINALGGTETFSVVAENPDGTTADLAYAWFFDDGTGPIAVGTDAPDLELTNIGTEDLGAYYCEVTYTPTGTTIYGNQAFLTFVPLSPTITGEPESKEVTELGTESAVFTVVAENPEGGSTDLAYLWYHDDAPMTSEIASTLTIDSVNEADLGAYYCEVMLTTNSETVDSAVAYLILYEEPALIMYMPMDNDANDIVGLTPKTVDAEPLLLDGKFGNELVLRNANQGDEAHDVSYASTFTSARFTVSMWVRYEDDMSGTNLIEIPNANGMTTISTGSPWSTGLFAIDFPITGTVQIECPGVFDKVMHHLVCTYDGNRLKVYKDGAFVTDNGSDIGERFPVSTGDMAFSPGDGNDSWRGRVDDVRIFNYALDDAAVADLYVYSPDPVIVTPPENITISAFGGTESFIVVAENPEGGSTGMTYAWFFDDPNGPAIAVGTDASDLVLTNIGIEDLGEYYCVVTYTPNGTKATSGTVSLSLFVEPELLIHAPMDGDPNDIIAPVNPLTATGALTYSDEPLVGTDALWLNSNGSTSVSYDASIYTGEITIAAWLNPENTNDTYTQIFGPDLAHENAFQIYTTEDAPAPTAIMFEMSFPIAGRQLMKLNDGNMAGFHHFVFSYDGNTMKTFVDGTLRIESAVIGEPMNPFTSFDVGVPYPGWHNVGYRGQIDDLQLYNYGLSAVEAAQLYVDVEGGSICLGGPDYDLSGDCEVNLGDLAALAVGWLTTMDSDDLAGLAGEWLESGGQLVE